MTDYFFWCGVALNFLGALALLGLLAWQAIEMWVRFNDVRGPMLRFYWAELKAKKRGTTDDR